MLPEVDPFDADPHRPLTPQGSVLVTGPMSAGTRVLARIVSECPEVTVFHDKGHGSTAYTDQRATVIITRDPTITDQSRAARHRAGIPRERSMVSLPVHYPDALWVTYEALVVDSAAVIAEMADHFGVEPWPTEIEVYDGNAHWT